MKHYKTREEKLAEYNAAHPVRDGDILALVKRHFKDNHLDLAKASKEATKLAKRILDERTYESIHFILYENPEGAPRPRGFRGHFFSPGAAENKRYFAEAIHAVTKTLKLVVTPAEIAVDLYLPMPANVPPHELLLFEAKILSPISKPDYDNAAKPYTDMMTGIITVDDDLFHRAVVSKYYSLLPRIEVTVTYQTAIESDYIYKKLKGRKLIKQGIKDGTIVLTRLGERKPKEQ